MTFSLKYPQVNDTMYNGIQHYETFIMELSSTTLSITTLCVMILNFTILTIDDSQHNAKMQKDTEHNETSVMTNAL
jgi:hypothetical protein